jgi:ribosomal protein S12 methylthiotransferase
MKNKIAILSLGCPRNLVDSENILGRLKSKGQRIVDIGKAEVAIVNTCAFIEDAKQESIDAILDLIALKKEGKLKKIIVHGCLAQRYKDELRRELPEVDAFVGRVSLNHGLKRFPITPKHYAYLKVCEGCINNCSFCVIPRIKGKFLSLETETVLEKVKSLEQEGVSEINIIGQDITGYGLDLYGDTKLESLVEKIAGHSGNIGWIRLLYLYPSRVREVLLKLIAESPKICKYIDLPIQHINDRILRLMHRRTAKKDILKLIDKVRKIIPGVAIRTSLIVGFPSETDREFKELLAFIEEVRFERLGAFIYSREQGTVACLLKKQIPERIKQERLNTLMSRQQIISTGNNKKLLGKTIEVLIDERGNGFYLGRSQYDAPEVDGQVYVRSKKILHPGDFTRVKITDTLEYDLVGEVP